MQDIVFKAALNNAHWCEIVSRSHDAIGNIQGNLWFTLDQPPMYYPNIVTLSNDVNLGDIEAITRDMAGSVSLKDSFNNLALQSIGFTKLFDAQWIKAPIIEKPVHEYVFIENDEHLKAWELAWSPDEYNDIFNNIILRDPRTRFIAIYEQDKIIAGAVAFENDDIIGLSNIFCNVKQPDMYWQTCVYAAQSLNTRLPVVDYEHGEELELAKHLGFTELGNLSVWIREQ